MIQTTNKYFYCLIASMTSPPGSGNPVILASACQGTTVSKVFRHHPSARPRPDVFPSCTVWYNGGKAEGSAFDRFVAKAACRSTKNDSLHSTPHPVSIAFPFLFSARQWYYKQGGFWGYPWNPLFSVTAIPSIPLTTDGYRLFSLIDLSSGFLDESVVRC